jgi:FkbM family methyltransferase
MQLLKNIAARLPPKTRHQLKLTGYGLKMASGSFVADDSEWRRLEEFAKPGDTAIDVGANVGHYTRKLSRLVGPTGRVIAFEPMAETFATLAGNMCDLRNVTLLNMAASTSSGTCKMNLPANNFYRASISDEGEFAVLTIPLDAFAFERCNLLKIDAEGHDFEVLKGATDLISRCRPIIIIETWEGTPAAEWLVAARYRLTKGKDSPNMVGLPQ